MSDQRPEIPWPVRDDYETWDEYWAAMREWMRPGMEADYRQFKEWFPDVEPRVVVHEPIGWPWDA